MDSAEKRPLRFKIVSKRFSAKSAILHLPHGEVRTPIYMPVGTYGAIKGIDSLEMSELGCNLMLSNTYHLSNTPGSELVEKMGGLHQFINFKGNLLTDSGGFQMVSLLKFAQITEKGVSFEHPKDGSQMLLTPEESIRHQNSIGADIIMALDDVVPATCLDQKRFAEACSRSVRWLDRCVAAHKRPEEQSLFAIIQGGLDPELRAYCLEEMIKRDLPGYAIGGLAGGEEKDKFWRIVHQCTQVLPKNKPIYLMGVGYPVDLVVCSVLGCDMFDCVFPSRVARFGYAFSKNGILNIKEKKYSSDKTPIEDGCECQTCARYSKSYLNSIVCSQLASCSLITIHNFVYTKRLMDGLRLAIEEDTLEEYVYSFLVQYFGDKGPPAWVIDALKAGHLDYTDSF